MSAYSTDSTCGLSSTTTQAEVLEFHALLTKICESLTDQKEEGEDSDSTTTLITPIISALKKNQELSYLASYLTGKTPLIISGTLGSLKLTTLLIQNGAPWNAVDRTGNCAGNYASDNGYQEIVNYLVEIATTSEMLLGAAFRTDKTALPKNVAEAGEDNGKDVQPCTKPEYLKRAVKYDGDVLLDEDEDAVMMEWEVSCYYFMSDLFYGIWSR